MDLNNLAAARLLQQRVRRRNNVIPSLHFLRKASTSSVI